MDKNNLRIENHPVLGEYIKGKEVKITFDGKVITAYKGETIATALIASGIKVFRRGQIIQINKIILKSNE